MAASPWVVIWLRRLANYVQVGRRPRLATTRGARAQDIGPVDDIDQWLAAMLKKLHLTSPFSLDEMLTTTATYLRCDIVVQKRDFVGSALYGACYPTHNAYVIAIGYNLTRRQVVRTVCHELAHILRGHVQLTELQYREFEPVTWQDVEAEDIARAMEARMDDERGRRSLGNRFWDTMGGDV